MRDRSRSTEDGPRCKTCDRILQFKEEFRDKECDLCKFQKGEIE